jgi:hypothetical protein
MIVDLPAVVPVIPFLLHLYQEEVAQVTILVNTHCLRLLLHHTEEEIYQEKDLPHLLLMLRMSIDLSILKIGIIETVIVIETARETAIGIGIETVTGIGIEIEIRYLHHHHLHHHN